MIETSNNLESYLAANLKRIGWSEALVSVSSTPKKFPAVVITTQEVTPIHTSAIINRYDVMISVVGPSFQKADIADEIAHTNNHKRLPTDLGKIMRGNILAGKYTLTNCIEIPPQITQHNQTSFFESGYRLTFLG